MAEIYKEYIHLNASTQEYIDANISRCINGGRILGVHVRGTDFNHGYSGHPRVVTPKEYLEKTKEIFSKGKYDRIFLATEDSGALELFRNEFDKELVYYDDVFRSANDIGPHIMPDNRPLHHYKLGLEVLRDVYTLANCDALVCGLSQVSFTARYVNLALGRKFEQVEVINKGINKNDSACAKKHRRIWIKEHN